MQKVVKAIVRSSVKMGKKKGKVYTWVQSYVTIPASSSFVKGEEVVILRSKDYKELFEYVGEHNKEFLKSLGYYPF